MKSKRDLAIEMLKMEKMKQKKNPDNDEENDSEEEYVIERIVKHRKHKNQNEYFIKWEGYSSDENTWEPEGNIPLSMIKEYWKTLGDKNKKNDEKNAQKSNSSDTKDKDDQNTEQKLKSNKNKENTENEIKKNENSEIPKETANSENIEDGEDSKSTQEESKNVMKQSQSGEENQGNSQKKSKKAISPGYSLSRQNSSDVPSSNVIVTGVSYYGVRYIYQVEVNGKKTAYTTGQMKKKYPQQLIAFFEKHITFGDPLDVRL